MDEGGGSPSLSEILGRASELTGAEREEYLDRACQGRPELRLRVESLLTRGEAHPEFLESPYASAVSPLDRGHVLGEFEIIEELGRGGMGVVYSAYQRSLERTVAIKVFVENILTTKEETARFHREAKAIAKLQHQNVVPVYADGIEGATHWFAMEWVKGSDLARELRRVRESASTPRSEASKVRSEETTGHTILRPRESGHVHRAVRITKQIAEALQAAHAIGLVHRDVKPANILLHEDGRALLSDFGLARDERLGSLTASSVIAGTPHYMSPEQARVVRESVDHRTDVYSLGVVLYELLTLQRPFEGQTSADVLLKIRAQRLAPVRSHNPAIPRDLETVTHKAMSPSPRERYATAGEFAADLGRFLRHEAVHATRPSGWSRAGRHLRRNWRGYGAAAAAVLLVFASVLFDRSVAAGKRLSGAIERCQAVQDEEDWRALGLKGRAAFVEDLRVLAARRDRLDPEELDALEDLLARSERFQRRDQAEARDLIRRGFEEAVGIEAFDAGAVSAGFARLIEALGLRGDGALDVEQELRALLPRLSVSVVGPSGEPIEGEVTLQALDPVLGVVVGEDVLGLAPITDEPTEPGVYRVTVRVPGALPREFSRVIQRASRTVSIVCRIDPDGNPTAGMSRIPAGELRFPASSPRRAIPHAGEPLSVPSFWVDPTPVSVGAYRTYMASTGVGRPAYWARLEGLPGDPWPEILQGRHDELPMTGLSWLEARDYAEWRGVRLLSAVERDHAGSVGTNTFFPYAVTTEEDPYRGVVDGVAETSGDLVARARNYLENAGPVIGADDQTSVPYGLHHLLGNVGEWTESIGVSLTGGRFVVDPDRRMVLGWEWTARQDGADLRARGLRGTGDDYAVPTIGFRCALTAF